MSYRRITVTMTTSGSVTPGFEEVRKDYTWNGDPDKSEAARTGGGGRKVRPGSGGDVNATRREKRLDEFAAALGYPDPWDAPRAAVIEAGKRVGVGDRTAKSYHFELKQRQLRDGEVCDA